jgi:mannose-6-phosphate isomerase-like protein (cupin superfamily)
MAKLFDSPTRIQAAGNKPKIIDEFIGRVNSSDDKLSIARMQSPCGWLEPAQTPEFDEYTVVLKGALLVKTKEQTIEVKAGQAILASAGEWVQYSTPHPDGAEYIAVCLPAFSPDTVHREEK